MRGKRVERMAQEKDGGRPWQGESANTEMERRGKGCTGKNGEESKEQREDIGQEGDVVVDGERKGRTGKDDEEMVNEKRMM